MSIRIIRRISGWLLIAGLACLPIVVGCAGQQEEKIAELTKRLDEKEKEVAALKQEWDKMLEEATKKMQSEFVHELKKALSKVEQAQEIVVKTKRDANFNLGIAYTKAGMFKDAEQAYLNALAIDPTDTDCCYMLAILYDRHLNQPEQVVKCCVKLLNLAPPDNPTVIEIKKELGLQEQQEPNRKAEDYWKQLTPEEREELLEKITGIVDEEVREIRRRPRMNEERRIKSR